MLLTFTAYRFYIHNIPGVYSWINVTMNWLFSKYTHPRYGRVDLKELLCPHCDIKNVTEILRQNELLLRERGRVGVGAALARALHWGADRAAALWDRHKQNRKRESDSANDRDVHSDKNLYTFEIGLL